MPLRYSFEGPRLSFEFEGGTPAHDVYSEFHRAFSDPKCPASALLLVDLTRSTSLSSREPEMVKMLTEYVLQHPKRPGNRMAIVLTSSELARLDPYLATVRTGSPVKLKMFDDRSEALAWLEGGAAREA